MKKKRGWICSQSFFSFHASCCFHLSPIGLAFSTTEEELAKAFSQYGSVLNANIILNKTKNRSKGFGYATSAKEEEACKAQIGMNGKILHGRVIYVDV
ncbi:hypothetical protein GLYMA_11G010600v4 [Glycine max]|uniref:RRM domain-containing protein n=1 Tax=Glycine max TaxID=3847 RepID=K7LMF4_SOYBN|nr:hypothetical protein GYH30_029675 [Glycine max]KRH27720.1 hypothetical protein GLYMA_11G010600v4 [Glycine max]